MGKGRQLIERRIEMYNSGDLDQLTSGLAEDAVWITPSTKVQGRTAIGELLRAAHSVAPDRHIEPLAWVEEGDTIVMEYTWTGTHTEPLVRADGAVLPPTGKADHISDGEHLPPAGRRGRCAPGVQGPAPVPSATWRHHPAREARVARWT